MNEDQRISKLFVQRPFVLGIAALLIVVAILIVWAGKRQTAADKLIQQKLAALRASGEPITAADLAKMFAPPPPEQDALFLFSNAMEFAALNRPPFGLTPITGSAATPARGEKMSEPARGALKTFYADTATITNFLPPLAVGARFGTHWEVGVESVPVAPFVRIRSLMQLLGTRALCAAEAGDAEGASEMLAQGFRFAQAVPAESTLVEHMIRDACLGLACSATERCLNQVRFDDRQLDRLIEAVPQPDTTGFHDTLRVEHCLAIKVFTAIKGGRRLDDFISGGKKEPWWERLWERLRSRRPEYSDKDFIAYLDLIPSLRKVLELPPKQAIPEFARLFDLYRTNTVSEVANAVHPSWTKALSRHYEIEAQVAATRYALAIERFRLTHNGRLPRSMEDLAPQLLQSIPRDPIDNQPLRFRALTNGFVVFSIGADGVDNGGLERTNMTTQTNYDVTFTIER